LLLQDLQNPPENSRTLNVSATQTVHWWLRKEGEGTLTFLMDMSAQRNTERAYHSFLSDLSHEMRSPLSAISAHLDVISLPDIADASRNLSLDVIRREAERATRLLHDLSELSKLEMTGEFTEYPIYLALLVEEVVSGMILSAEEMQIAISLRADSPMPRVLGDPDRLKQVFANLLDNAIKYCRPTDKVEIDLHNTPDGVECIVRDTGPGIAAEHLPHLTERLYRGRTDVPGSGLGLALVEGILRKHHSHLLIESHTSGEHTGTVIRFLLPIVS
jgi:signal transduction histidine kinase